MFWTRFNYPFRRTRMALFQSTKYQQNYPGVPSSQVVDQLHEHCHRRLLLNTRHRDPFTLTVKSSLIPNGGFGLFIRAQSVLPKGTVVALYPGLIYELTDPILLASFNNQYVLQRNDGVYIDGKHSGLSKRLYLGSWKREKVWNFIEHDKKWLELRREGVVDGWNVGQLINNAPSSEFMYAAIL
jgi:hypothetical protein